MSYGGTYNNNNCSNPHKLIWLQILSVGKNKKAYNLSTAEDLSSFGYFQRSTVREHLVFAARTSSERCQPASRITISLKIVPISCHVYRNSDGLCAIAMTDQQYSDRVAHSLLTKMIMKFEQKFGNQWRNVTKDQSLTFEVLNQV